MMIALSAKNKLDFVKGRIAKPNDPLKAGIWQRCNDMITSWILNTLSKEIGDSVLYANTVADLWNELNDRFGQTNGARLYQLQKEICSINQGNSDIAGYYTRIKRAWDELAMVSRLPNCTCGAVQELLKYEQDQRLVQFLMRLNSDYNVTRGNILIMRPLPSIPEAYGILIHEERQRQIQSPTHISPEHTSLSVQTQASFKATHEDKKIPVCENCKKKGHRMSKCYRLIGFPKDFRFNKGKKIAANAYGGECSESTESRTESQISPELCSHS
ncbi:unnamed protein product [Cuscuta campestris]|uniref:Uncharacterized protein n=1 Tax=Cuscuta campestris TaxID=132261 RepID=A0A484KJQ2_9ASTE|nr:unnamed protein product [Cuscuta campestris]